MDESISEERRHALRQIEHEFGVVIRRLRRAIADRAVMVHPELSAASYSMLTALLENGPQRASSLAELFTIDKGAVSRQVQQLEELGLISRAPDPDDGRASILSITELGKERMRTVADLRRTTFDSMLAEWTEEELIAFAAAVSRYNASLGTGVTKAVARAQSH